jgi:predicted permease
MQTLIEDLRYGLRMLRKSPGFAVVTVLTLALGIGANTALFSVVNGVLLNPLPFHDPDQLVALSESKPNFAQGSISYPNFLDWQKDNHTFSAMAIARNYGFSLTGMGVAEQVNAEFISSDFFPLLGVKPVTGRTFAPGEDQVGAGPVALISAGFWQRKFSGAPDVLGKGLTLNGKDYTIVGVIPATFHLVAPSFQDRELYVPIGQWNNNLLPNRGAGLGIHGFGRLKPGITIEQAQADMDAVTRNLATAYPDDKGISANLVPLKQRMVGRKVQSFLFVLLAAVGFVLLIACVNVANLLLARSTGRMREFAVRAALGASRGRVVRQLLTESVLLAIAGGTLGLLLAAWGTRAALGVLPTALPRAEEVGLDARVLVFTMAISVLAGILFGLAPAFKTSQPDLHATLKEGGRGASGTRHRAQDVFVVVEMAMALVLLIGAGLMIRSLTHLWRVDPGFDPRNVLTFSLTLPPSMMTATPEAVRANIRALDEKLASVPGVRAASLIWGAFPLSDDDERVFWLEGQPKPASENDMSWTLDYIVDPGYLKAMGIPLEHGRFLSAHDNEHTPLVIAIDDVFARKFFPNQDPIGKRININGYSKPAEIVGIVGHVKQWGLDSDDKQELRSEMYLSFMQMADEAMVLVPAGVDVVVRSEANAPGLFDSIRHASEQMSREQVIYAPQTMNQIVSGSLVTQRFSMILLGIFAALALVLASVGIYGVISYVVGQRAHEIGIRLALGAERLHILRLILGRGGRLALAGVGLGLASALGLTRLMASLLYGVRATDPLTFAGVAFLLILIALAACYIPARRATKVDPMVALRYE